MNIFEECYWTKKDNFEYLKLKYYLKMFKIIKIKEKKGIFLKEETMVQTIYFLSFDCMNLYFLQDS